MASVCLQMPGAEASAEDQLLCAICLDVFTDPVTTSCGHNYCKRCIDKHWDVKTPHRCPMCNKLFEARPELRVNKLLSELVAKVRWSLKERAADGQAGRVCAKHLQPLDLFCRTDRKCICAQCSVSDHKKHRVVPLEEEYKRKTKELRKTETEIRLMIQERRQKISDLKRSVAEEDANAQVKDSTQVFTALKISVKRGLGKFVETVREKRRRTSLRLKAEAEDFIGELEREIDKLSEQSTEVEELSHAQDRLHLVETLPALRSSLPTKDWTDVGVQRASHDPTVAQALVQLERMLRSDIKMLLDIELKRLQLQQVNTVCDASAPPASNTPRYFTRSAVQDKTPDAL